MAMEYMSSEDIFLFYTFQEEIGSGNFATVFRAIHQESSAEVAIKRIEK